MRLSDNPLGIKLRTKEYPTISTGLPLLDEVLLGGFHRDALIHFYGEPGSGKTTFALQILANILQQGWRGIWLDCNGAFSLPRLQSLLTDNPLLLQQFLLARPTSFQHQTRLIQHLQYNLDRVGIVVADPITHFYRAERFKEASIGYFHELVGIQLSALMGIAHLQHIPTIVINYASLHKPLVEKGFERVEKYRCYFNTVPQQEEEEEANAPKWWTVCIERAPEKFSQNRTLTFQINAHGICNLRLLEEGSS